MKYAREPKAMSKAVRAVSRRNAISVGLEDFYWQDKPEVSRTRERPPIRFSIKNLVVGFVMPDEKQILLNIAGGDILLAAKFKANLDRGMKPSKAANKVGGEQMAKLASSPYTKVMFAETCDDITAVYADVRKGESCMTRRPESAGWLYGNVHGAALAHTANARCVVNLIDKTYGRAYGFGAEELHSALIVLGFSYNGKCLTTLPPTDHRPNGDVMTSATGEVVQYDAENKKLFFVKHVLVPHGETQYLVMRNGSSFTREDAWMHDLVTVGADRWNGHNLLWDKMEIMRRIAENIGRPLEVGSVYTYCHISDHDAYPTGVVPMGLLSIRSYMVKELVCQYVPSAETLRTKVVHVAPPSSNRPAAGYYIDGEMKLAISDDVWSFH